MTRINTVADLRSYSHDELAALANALIGEAQASDVPQLAGMAAVVGELRVRLIAAEALLRRADRNPQG